MAAPPSPGRGVRTLLLVAALVLAPAHADDLPGHFDYYVLSLSWSPHYCALPQARDDALQCAQRRHGFVVHGLWPQGKRDAPAFCASNEPQQVNGQIVSRYLPIMPSPRLIEHQWRKHGTCSGLTQEDYFAAVGRAWDRFRVPAAFQDGRLARTDRDTLLGLIGAANPGLPPEAIALRCRGQDFAEARLCLSRDLRPVACGAGVRGSCPRNGLRVRPVR
jgi:ribonuclease T2